MNNKDAIWKWVTEHEEDDPLASAYIAACTALGFIMSIPAEERTDTQWSAVHRLCRALVLQISQKILKRIGRK